MTKRPDPPRDASWEQIAQNSLLPGMTYLAENLADVVREAIHQFIEEFRAGLVNGAAPKKRGRPVSVREHIETAYQRRKAIVGKKGDERTTANGWSADPEERKREMRRRMGKRKAKPSVKLAGHPRDKDHPGHAAWVEMMRKVQKRTWAKLTPEERDERQRKLQAGHRRAA